VNEIDLKVLERIGHKGAELGQIIDVAGGDYDVDPLLRTGYLRIHRERIAETTGPRFGSDEYLTWYVLTPKAAEAIGIDPELIGSR
jgi:hypothetical protein